MVTSVKTVLLLLSSLLFRDPRYCLSYIPYARQLAARM